MSAEALPYTLLILLSEVTIGSIWVLWAADMRGYLAPTFLKFGAALSMVMAALTFVLAAKIAAPDEVDGYPLDSAFMPATRVLLAVLLAASIPYAIATLAEWRIAGLAGGLLCSLIGLASIAVMAQVFALPVWGYAGVLISLVAGALAVGAVSMGMVLGHWYLITPRLPEQPLREMTAFLLLALALQLLILIPNTALPHDSVASSVHVSIGESPFFWMRIAGGIAFPMVLTYMAYDSSGARAMQSATGLLYLAMALVLSGEILAKALMFVTGVPG